MRSDSEVPRVHYGQSAHLSTLCLCLTYWEFCQTISLFHFTISFCCFAILLQLSLMCLSTNDPGTSSLSRYPGLLPLSKTYNYSFFSLFRLQLSVLPPAFFLVIIFWHCHCVAHAHIIYVQSDEFFGVFFHSRKYTVLSHSSFPFFFFRSLHSPLFVSINLFLTHSAFPRFPHTHIRTTELELTRTDKLSHPHMNFVQKPK